MKSSLVDFRYEGFRFGGDLVHQGLQEVLRLEHSPLLGSEVGEEDWRGESQYREKESHHQSLSDYRPPGVSSSFIPRAGDSSLQEHETFTVS